MKKRVLEKDELVELYVNQNLGMKKIGKILKTNLRLIDKFLDLYQIKRKPVRKFEDLTDKKFGKLTVLKKDKKDPKTHVYYWLCKCECGKEKIIRRNALTSGATKSCGCLKKETCNVNSPYVSRVLFKKDLIDLYVNKQMSAKKVKKILKTNTANVNKFLKIYNIEIRRPKKRRGYKDISSKYWTCLIYRSKLKDREVKIKMKDAWLLFIKQGKKCALTGLDIHLSKTKDKENTASIDRIDSSKGYLINNIQWIHKDINWMKSDLSQKDFLNYCRLITENNKNV